MTDTPLKISFAAATLPADGALGIFVAENEVLAGVAALADAATNGAILRALVAADFTGKEGQSVTIYAPGAGLTRVVAVGLGDPAKTTEQTAEDAGGTMAALLLKEPAASIAADRLTATQAASIAFGATQRRYRFDRYRTKEKPEDKPKLAALTLLTDYAEAAALWPAKAALAQGIYLTRDLVSEPANILTPVEFATRLENLRGLGVTVTVHDETSLRALNFGAMLGVSQGSANPPRMVVMEWRGGAADEKPVAFIGKGVTFDTGGISIKPAAGMEDMKWDMAGAGAVAGAMAALAARHARANIVGLVGLVENMPSATAQRPGDVVTSASGQTIEVLNTDAEGRLVLCDVMHYAQEKFDPCLMIDLATLTGAIIMGLGHEHAGLFSNNDVLADNLLAASTASGEKLWRMPLHKDYDKQLKSDIADMKNIGGRPAGSITAAQFLQRFVKDRPWAHLDIAGTAWSTKDSATVPKGATAFGVKLLDRFIAARETTSA
jgi:leucyl aminopeptidase